jgi:hypothetical protein
VRSVLWDEDPENDESKVRVCMCVCMYVCM